MKIKVLNPAGTKFFTASCHGYDRPRGGNILRITCLKKAELDNVISAAEPAGFSPARITPAGSPCRACFINAGNVEKLTNKNNIGGKIIELLQKIIK